MSFNRAPQRTSATVGLLRSLWCNSLALSTLTTLIHSSRPPFQGVLPCCSVPSRRATFTLTLTSQCLQESNRRRPSYAATRPLGHPVALGGLGKRRCKPSPCRAADSGSFRRDCRRSDRQPRPCKHSRLGASRCTPPPSTPTDGHLRSRTYAPCAAGDCKSELYCPSLRSISSQPGLVTCKVGGGRLKWLGNPYYASIPYYAYQVSRQALLV